MRWAIVTMAFGVLVASPAGAQVPSDDPLTVHTLVDEPPIISHTDEARMQVVLKAACTAEDYEPLTETVLRVTAGPPPAMVEVLPKDWVEGADVDTDACLAGEDAFESLVNFTVVAAPSAGPAFVPQSIPVEGTMTKRTPSGDTEYGPAHTNLTFLIDYNAMATVVQPPDNGHTGPLAPGEQAIKSVQLVNNGGNAETHVDIILHRSARLADLSVEDNATQFVLPSSLEDPVDSTRTVNFTFTTPADVPAEGESIIIEFTVSSQSTDPRNTAVMSFDHAITVLVGPSVTNAFAPAPYPIEVLMLVGLVVATGFKPRRGRT